ncbi:type II toxin-antitoxin system prevent-host-death family antitoxin [Agrobacterium rubi]|uniref:type II toxin-antitoxin system prevent-host-death family antitoxin n=1 Tax=Agrobacterium rubi TaxID=28099 RepID=UPI000DD8964C|nr:type II toxin-antitoxin system prevent-host-death family antitoxin [Agrobacterium rubi]NTF07286.1 type II toxin-antitoxin system prevent-host-death family antitoxin [Agrobacterium rubi]NTF19542.1 type II toxin-antitoxin system prevent-host-death family antitoxin [Agrobacterium rubi]NTF26505.1 type II toxin-antitoxin system prevent-host-death family antitoxin [Agrobacterium rubi]
MSQKSITTAEFMRHFGRYHDQAQKEPITLTKHGRPSVVVLPVELFEKLASNHDVRQAYTSGEMPDDIASLFREQLENDSKEYQASRDD